MNQLSIKVDNLQFSYKTGNEILHIKKLEVEKNKKVFVYGPSGCGKSTLLNILAGVLPFNNGEIEILDKKYKSMTPSQKDHFRGEKIGYIFQSFNLLPFLNVKENILLPCLINPNRAKNIDVQNQYEKLTQNLGISSYSNQNVSELSVGQQQRVAVARALIGSPEIIIADEPTSSLDEDVTNEFMNLLLDEWKIKPFTLFFVSHDKRLSKYFDQSFSIKGQ